MHPVEIGTIVEDLTSQPLGVGLFLAGAGVAFMLLGHRIFRGLIGLSFGGVGYVLGSQLAPPDSYVPILVGLVVGAGLAVLSVYFVRVAVAVLTGGWCGLIVAHFAAVLGGADYVIAMLAAFAFAAAISLAFIVHEEIIAFVTSLEGSFLCVAALIIFFSHSSVVWAHLRSLLTSNGVFGPFLVLTGTVTGFYFQLADLRHKNSGTQM
jgi:hypothetical protein